MAGIKGKITRSVGGKKKSVYLSDRLGMWRKGRYLHISSVHGRHGFNIPVTRQDGLIYDVLMALYREGMRLP